MAQKIIPNLLINGNADEAANFYSSNFPDGKIIDKQFYSNNREEGLIDFQQDLTGQVLTIEFELAQQSFVAINASTEFKFNPSISFMLYFAPFRDKQVSEHLAESSL